MLNRLLKLDGELNNSTLRHNFMANVMDGGLYAFAMSIISLQTVLPVFVKNIGGTNVSVGLIPVIWMMGINFPQIFFARYVQKFPYKKSLMLKTGLIQRLPWAFLAIATFFFMTDAPVAVSLLLFFTFFTMAALSGSFNLPVWFDLITKITPVKVRGRLFAIRSLIGAVLGIIGGWVVLRVLDMVAFPANFAILFMAAFVLMMISFGFLVTLREEEPNQPKQNVKLKEYYRNLPVILKTHINYRNFLIADALFITSITATAFFTVHAIDKFMLSDAYAGTFTMIMMMSMIAGSLLLGYMADMLGHRINIIIASTAIFVACLIALFVTHVYLYYFVFVLSAMTLSIMMISRLPIIAEMCSDDERPTYVALTNMITSPFFLAGILGGWAANRFGYEIVFIFSAIFAGAAAVWLITMVREPRSIVKPI